MTHQNRTAAVLWRGRWTIAAVVAAAVVLGLVAAATSSKVYEATALFQVSIPNAPASETTDLANQSLARNYATLISSQGFLERAQENIDGGRLSADALAANLTATTIEGTSLMQLAARDGTPEQAEAVVKDVANQFVATLQRDAAERSADQRREINAAIESLNDQIEELRAEAAPDSIAEISSLEDARDALQRQSANVVSTGVAQGASAALAAAPTVNPDPVRPRPVLNVTAALLLGLLAGIGLVLVRDRFDATLLSSKDAAEEIQTPILASVPLMRRMSATNPALKESYEVLRANLDFRARGDDLRVITVGSHNAGEGKTSVIEGVARASSRGGSNVLLIDGDMRMGKLSTRLGHERQGLAHVLRGRSTLDQALVELQPGLSLLPSRGSTSDPASLLRPDRATEILAALRERFDLVLIDSPPLAHLADGALLASLSDGFVLVARAGTTKLADLRASARMVEESRTEMIGLVVLERVSIDKSYYRTLTETRSPEPLATTHTGR